MRMIDKAYQGMAAMGGGLPPVFVAPVTDLVASNPTETTMDLAWTAPTGSDNAIDYYEVWVNGVFYENTVDDSVTWAVTGLTAGTEYDFQLKTVDVLGNKSALSNTSTEKTTGGVVIPTGDLLAYLRFNNNVNDETSLNSPTSSGVTYGDGLYTGDPNEAVLFDNLKEKVTIPNNARFNFGNGTTDDPFSITLAVRPTNLGTLLGDFYVKFLVSKRGSTDSADREWQLYFNNNASPNLSFRLFDQSTGRWIEITTTMTFSNNTIYHISATYDGSGSVSGMKIFVNGVSVAVTDTSSGSYTAMEAFTTPVAIGYTNFSNNFTLFSRIDGLGIWGVELTPDEVEAVYDKQAAGLNIL